ncbi:MAG TPA: hypothetical protein QF401_06715, partial [Candidatus Poseidoniaceae archaeon]|nr:hypothetical protein [Candidatus Poseidoniaceae archaeon]
SDNGCITTTPSIDKLIRISCKGLSQTPLHFIFRYKGDSVGRYRRYPLYRNILPLIGAIILE